MPRRTPSAATALPKARPPRARPRLVPSEPPPVYDPAEDAAAVRDALLARHTNTTEGQWKISCTWVFESRSVWKAEAWHPSIKIPSYASVGDEADEAMEKLKAAVQRGA